MSLWPTSTTACRSLTRDRTAAGRPLSRLSGAPPAPDPAGRARSPRGRSAARGGRPWPRVPSGVRQHQRTRPDPASAPSSINTADPITNRQNPSLLAPRSLGEHGARARPQSCPREIIRANVAVVLMAEQFSETIAGAVDPALDRADLRTADHRRFLVSPSFGSDQKHRLSLLGRKLHQGRMQFRKLYAPSLFREGGEVGRKQPIHILPLAPSPAILGVEEVAHQREHPCLQVGAGLEAI